VNVNGVELKFKKKFVALIVCLFIAYLYVNYVIFCKWSCICICIYRKLATSYIRFFCPSQTTAEAARAWTRD